MLRVDMVRNSRGMSIRGLARRAGTTKSYIQRIEAGEANPSIAVMCRLAQALGCDITDLIK